MTRRQGDAYQRSKRSAGGAAGTFLITLLLVIAVGVFAYSGWRLYNYYRAYKQGTDEYSELNEEYVKPAEPAAADTQKETEASSASSGAEVLTDLTSLENPTARSEILEGANRESTVENGQTKELPKLKNPVDFAQLRLHVAVRERQCDDPIVAVSTQDLLCRAGCVTGHKEVCVAC